MTEFKEGQRVRVLHPTHLGALGQIINRMPQGSARRGEYYVRTDDGGTLDLFATEISPIADEERLYTLEEARRELNRQICREHGHDWHEILAGGRRMLPVSFGCARCGESVAVAHSPSQTKIDYENDWAGESRIDPNDGNAYVLRKVGWVPDGRIGVIVNDIMGGHTRTVLAEEWLQWRVSS